MSRSRGVSTFIAGVAGAIWEWVGIARELRLHGEPQDGPGWANALEREAESMARLPTELEPARDPGRSKTDA